MTESIIEIIQKHSWILLVLILVFGWFQPIFMFITFICMIAPVIFSFKYGRAWCGNFCPRGSFNNRILRIISKNKNIPQSLNKPVIRLIAFVSLMTLFTYNLSQSNGSLMGIGMAFIKMMAITTLIEIGMGIFIQPNAWCAICPMGSVASCVSKVRGSHEGFIEISDKCVGCNHCTSACPIEINLQKYRESGIVTNVNCMKCRKCVKSCPQNALQWNME